MANRVDFLFSTGRFNLSKVGDHFINECCFGEDLIAWLRDKVTAGGYTADEPYQEDWGWEVEFRRGSEKYFVGASGTSDGDPARPDYGEWRAFVESRTSLKDRLLRRTYDNHLPAEIERLLAAEPDFEAVRRDA
jgi:hypothetical protein